MTHTDKAYLRLHLGILLAGATGIFGRLISLSELPLVWMRVLIAAASMTVVMALSKSLRRVSATHFLHIGACGIMLAFHWVCFYASIKFANVSIAVVCIALDGFFTALLDSIIHRRTPSMREILLSMITVAGIALIFGIDTRYRLGIAFGAVASLLYALFSICSKHVQAHTSQRSSTMLLYELISGAVILTLVMPLYATLFPASRIIPTTADWLMLIVFGSIFTVGPFLLQLQALRHISAFTVNLSYNLEPIYSIILAMIIFDEANELTPAFWIGVLLIIMSVILQTVYSKKRQPKTYNLKPQTHHLTPQTYNLKPKTYNLKPDQGIPPHIIMLMAMMAGLTVANLYYNQPLLEMIRSDLHTTSSQANLIAVITQVGYALGLLFIVPTGDLFSRRKIIVVCMVIAALMTAAIGLSDNIFVIWGASLTMGACSIVPQLFIPVAGQFSKPENKARNMGYVLSGLLTGILAARVVSGIIGEWFGWRMMYYIAGIVMVMCLALTLWLMPRMQQNFSGSYLCLMRSVVQIFTRHPRIRLNAIRAAFGFGSMLAFWACLAFHLAGEPLRAGSDAVGYLGICGVAGALVASGIGKYIPRYGVKRFSIVGASIQIAAWMTAWLFGTTYAGLVLTIILIDIGLQCLQLSNQSACIQAVPEASNRANTIFMTTYFIGGSLGTLLAGQGWYFAGWHGVCLVGISFALISLFISIIFDKKN